MQCVILAGGLATRMRPLTDTIPKALIPVDGRPFVDHQLGWLAGHGVTDVVMCIGYRGDAIRAYIDAGRRRAPRAARPLRRRGRATCAAPRARCGWRWTRARWRNRSCVTYGDSFLPIDFGDVFRAFAAAGKPALMTVFRNDGRWDTSNVIFDGRMVTLYDKQRTTRPASDFTFIDYGLTALSRQVIADEIPGGRQRGSGGAVHALSVRGALAGLEVAQRFYEIGSPAGLEDFEAVAATKAPDRPRPGRRAERALVDNRPSRARTARCARREVAVFPWVPGVLRDLTRAGFGLAIASNQPAAAKGKTTRAELQAVHAAIVLEATGAGGVILSSHICYHRAEDACTCRKPATGLLAEAFARNPGYDLAASWMVGDRAPDVIAGAAFGVQTALVGDVAARGARGARRARSGADVPGPRPARLRRTPARAGGSVSDRR